MNEEGFNSGYVEIRTLEGDKFLKDLKIGDSVLSKRGYCSVVSLDKILARPDKDVYTVYYHTEEKEGVLARISGGCELWPLRKKIRDLKPGDQILIQGKFVKGIVDYVERMETVNRYIYKLKLTDKSFYADGVCLMNNL